MTYNPNTRTIHDYSKEPTGFPDRTSTSIAFNNGTRTLTVYPTGSSFDYYIQGVRYTHLGPAETTISDTEGLWYIYFDGYTLQNTQTFTTDIITRYAYVAVLYWDSVNNDAIYLGEERHGLTMDGQTHLYLHNSVGAVFINGFGLADFQIDGTGDSSADGYFSVGNGIFHDEDIRHTVTDGSPQDLYPISYLPVFHRTGSDGYWRAKDANAFPVIYSGTAGYTGANGRLPYNQWTGSIWQLTQVTSGNYVLVHVIATNDILNPIIALQGQAEYANISQARTGATTELASIAGLPFSETVALGSVIYQTSNTYTNLIKARIVSTDTGSNYVDFRKVSSLPSNQISDHGNLSGLSDPDHPASAIFTSTSSFNGILSGSNTTVQSALDTLDNLSIAQISPLTTKGDLLTRDASTHVRVGVGTDGYVLMADSTVSSGIKWAASANTALSNLTTTSINQSLLPSTDITYNLGSPSKRWKDGYFGPSSLHITSLASETGGTAKDWSIGIGSDGYMSVYDGGSRRLAITPDGYVALRKSGGKFSAFDENSRDVKFATKFNSITSQYGLGQMYNETWIGAIDDGYGKIGFYTSLPNNGISSATTNADMYVKTTGVEIKNNLLVNSTTLFADSVNNRVGIGTITPTERLHIVGGNALFGGTISSPGAGTSSERFGALSAAAGNNSVSIGNDSTSTGASSVALGYSANTSSNASSAVAIGSQSESLSANNVVIGASANTSTNTGNSVAIGYNTTISASANASVAIGAQTNITTGASSSIAIGYDSTASGVYAVAIGESAIASGTRSLAIGRNANASATASIMIGFDGYADAPNTFASGSTAFPINSIYFGKGISSPSPTTYSIKGTAGSADGYVGGGINIDGGLGGSVATAGGEIKIRTAAAGTGTTLVDRVTVAASGTITIGSHFDLAEITAPSTPSTNFGSLYVKSKASTNSIYFKNDAGTEFDLTLDGYTGSNIGETITGGTVGSILFVDTGPVIAQDNSNLFWNNGTNRLGLGTSDPQEQLHVANNIRTDGFIQLAEIAAPATPATGFGRIYEKTDGYLYFKNDDGTEFDLTAASMAIGNTITSATAGSVLFAGVSSVLAQDNSNFFWDDTDNCLRIGANSGSSTDRLDVFGTVNGTSIAIRATGASTSIGYRLVNSTLSYESQVAMAVTANDWTTNSVAGDLVFDNNHAGGHVWGTSNTARMRLTSAGNLGIGDFAATEKLSVAGNVKLTTTGSKFAAYNEDSKTIKFANWYASDSDQYGMGQLYYEMWFGAINAASQRQIGFYTDLPDNGIGSSATNADLYVKPTVVQTRRGFVANNSGGDYDTQIKGDNDANLFYADASVDRVGFGTSTPGRKVHVYSNDGSNSQDLIVEKSVDFDVGIAIKSFSNTKHNLMVHTPAGALSASNRQYETGIRLSSNAYVIASWDGSVNAEYLRVGTGGTIFNEQGADLDFRAEGDTDTNLLFLDASADAVCIGTNTAQGKLTIDNLSASVDIADFRDNGTSVWKFRDGGNLEMQGDYDLLPATDDDGDLGTASKRFSSLHVRAAFAEISVSPQTAANVSPATSDSRTAYTNEGATAEVNFNLPSAAAGLQYTFIVQDVDGIQITAASGDTIRVAGSVSASGGTAEATTIGNVLKLVAINATEWVAISVIGTWTVT